MEIKQKAGFEDVNVCKKNCLDLLAKINVRDDDYLRVYLKKNNLFTNGSEHVSRRNKYDFIFDN